MPSCLRSFALVIYLLSFLQSARADGLEDVLTQPIVKPRENDQRLTEFIVKRIPPLKLAPTFADWERETVRLRRELLDKVLLRGVPKSWLAGPPRVEWGETLSPAPDYRIRKLRYEVAPNLWIPALMYEPVPLTGKVPVVLNQNGHDTTGKAAPREQLRGLHLAKRGIIALNYEWLYMGELKSNGYWHDNLALLDLVGIAGVSIFHQSLARGLDVLLAHEHADPERVAVTGWSGGAQQTVMFSAVDSRVTASIPVAGHSAMEPRIRERYSVGHHEVNPTDLVTVAEYTHLTAMLAPRPALLIYNAEDDCCHKASFAKPITFDPVLPFYQQAGVADRFRYYINHDPGNHNYDRDNREQLYRFLNDFFFVPRGGSIAVKEADARKEVKSDAALKVGLPADNATFNSLALAVAEKLPREFAGETVDGKLKRLTDVLRFARQPIRGEPFQTSVRSGDLKVERFRLYDGDDWVLPAVVVSPAQAKSTALFLADGGYAKHSEEIAALAAAGTRVIGVDLLFCGGAAMEEAKLGTLSLNVQFLPTVGARPLGVQCAEALGALEFFRERYGFDQVELHTVGPRTGVAGLCAAAFDGGRRITSHDAKPLPKNQLPGWGVLTGFPKSLKELLNFGYFDAPELYCFGLLEQFDIPQLQELAGRHRGAANAGKTP